MDDFAGERLDYYALLGVGPRAGAEEIKQAYLRQVKQWHPDRNPQRTAEAEERTKVLNQAYHVLGDPERRRHYDRMLRFTRGRNPAADIDGEEIGRKLDKAYPALRKALAKVRLLYALFKDAGRGAYKLHPANLALIGGGLLYFLLPADLIPDIIPLVGYLDDVAVLSTIANSLKDELEAYRAWKAGRR